MIHFGASEIDITPTFPIVLGAYHRYRGNNIKTKQVLDPLKATVFYFSNSNNYKVLLVNLDLIWVSASFTESIRTWCEENVNMYKRNVFISATHTHSSPQIHPAIEKHGKKSDAYLHQLMQDTKKAIRMALNNQVEASINTYRRKSKDLPIVNRIKTGFCLFKMEKASFHSPNPGRSVQQPLQWAEIVSAEGNIIGFMINLAAHPIFNKANFISADYPGKIRKKLKNHFDSSLPVQFLQGFAGDVRPNYPDRSFITRMKNLLLYSLPVSGFRNDIYEIIDQFSQKIIDSLINAGPTDLVKSEQTHKKARLSKTRVFDSVRPELQVQRLDIPEGPSLVGVNAEVFSEYAAPLLQDKSQRVLWPVGYANDMIGYIPDKEILEYRSGYEYESWQTFNNPRPFTLQSREFLMSSLHRMLD